MSFVERAIDVQFMLAEGTLQDDNNVVTLTGHRCEALISNPGGDNMVGSLQLRVFGMKAADMNKFSTAGANPMSYKNNVVKVSAGDVGGQIRQVFEGTIIRSAINYNTATDVSFNVTAVSAFFAQVAPTSPNSYKGEVDVATVIGALAKSIGYSFFNNGVSVRLSNQYLSGSAIDQIKTIANAARIPVCIENGAISIWPNDGTRDGLIIALSPESGLVGYPEFTDIGFAVRSLFNPDIQNGRKLAISRSQIEKANGNWVAQTVMHELSTLAPNGPWFTNTNLIQQGLYVSIN
jgi:hypothetical protein